MKKILLAGAMALSISSAYADNGGGFPPYTGPPPLGWIYGRYVDCDTHSCWVGVQADGANIRRYPNGPVFTSLTNGVPLIPLQRSGPWALVAVPCNLFPVTWSDTAGVPLNTCGGEFPVFGVIGEALRAFGAFRGAIENPQPEYQQPGYPPPPPRVHPRSVEKQLPHRGRTEPLPVIPPPQQAPEQKPDELDGGGPVVPLTPSPPSSPPRPYQQR